MHRFSLLALALLCAAHPLFSQDARVLIIGLDGLRSDCLEAAETPALDGLIENGVFSPDALNNDITYSGPGWSAMVCGAWSDAHGVTNNDFTGSNYATYPSFLDRLETINPELNTYSICHWSPINDYIQGDVVDESINTTSDQAVADAAGAILGGGNPHAMFLHFDDVDLAGHSYGFSPNVPAYIDAIETVDAHVAEVLSALTSRPNYEEENWLILTSTDHGGIGYGHGGESIDEQIIFFSASGPSVDPELVVKDTLEILPPPENCVAPGAAELQFEGNGDAVHIAENPLLSLGSDQDFTIEVRIRTEASPDVAIVGNKDWDSGLNPGFVFSFEYPNGPAWKVNIGDGDDRADANGAAGVSDGQWHTLSCSFDRDGSMRLYTDGVFSAEEDISGIGNLDVGEGWYFGSDIDGGYSYTGAIAEVRFWHGVLDDATILDWHCSAITEAHPAWEALQGHWQLTEGAGTDIGSAANAELSGTADGTLWQVPESLIVFDYSNTPRIVDVAVTALDHMCVTIDPAWNLAGISWVDGCNSADVFDTDRCFIDARIFPNPGSDSFQITGITPGTDVEVYHPNGKCIHKSRPGATSGHIAPGGAESGMYLIRVIDGEQRRTLRWIRQN
ncbi:MAG: alkaline phosphatase family protein [Bacteroidota bacterium]|nr:alkaline phosphatase family protein [Bacteroidota bacterium]